MKSPASQSPKKPVTSSFLNDLLMALAFANVELTPEQYNLLEQPKATWPPELRAKLKRYGGEDLP